MAQAGGPDGTKADAAIEAVASALAGLTLWIKPAAPAFSSARVFRLAANAQIFQIGALAYSVAHDLILTG